MVDPAVNAVVLTMASAADVPTVPWSITVVPSDFNVRKNDAVPVAAADAELIAANVALPAVPVSDVPLIGAAEQFSVASNVLPDNADAAAAGGVPL